MKLLNILLILFVALGLISCDNNESALREKSFDDGWLFYRGKIANAEKLDFDDRKWSQIDLPHDWSIEDIPETNSPFDAESITEVSGGFTVGGTGWYRKHFFADENWKDKQVLIYFDGIYMNSDIWINEHHVKNHFYGYTAFEIDVTPYLKFGVDNLIAVEVKNEGINSRWYTGSGIYRNSFLKIIDPLHFENWGTTITTTNISDENAQVIIKNVITNSKNASGNVLLESIIIDNNNKTIAKKETAFKINGLEKIEKEITINVKSPKLWSTDEPNLYYVVNKLKLNNKIIDEEKHTFGIRKIEFSAENGFLLNGKSLKLKGGCIHHDNGILGAKAFSRAEERKIELLKLAGFNALRMSHNPPSTALLDACDRLGMLVIDEAFDMWRYGHYKGDYGDHFDRLWRDDVYSMVSRDKNHPSIIMWSIGNEIKDKESPEIVQICRELTDYVKSLDNTRPVTAGVNNIVDQTDDFLNTLDVSGYNYCLNRYELDAKRHPKRIIYASESYASQAYDYWKGVERNPWVIGDFIWTAFDYIGEASIGWRGYPQNKNFFPWNHAYCGDLNISGERRPQSYLRETLWSDQPVSHIFVSMPEPSFPLNPEKEGWSVWDFSDVIDHWNFPEYEGKDLNVNVYTNCHQVELFLDEKSFGKQNNTEDKKNSLSWTVPYKKGILKAVSYIDGKEVSQKTLEGAGITEKIKLTADRTELTADGNDLSFISLELVDNKGAKVQTEDKKVVFSIEGDAKIEGVGNANPMSIESFVSNTRNTWRGSCLVVVRSGKTNGSILIKADIEGLPNVSITLSQKKL